MIWYPYEQLKTMKAPYEIVDANGVYLYTKDQKLIDSVSSWWSVIHGYKKYKFVFRVQRYRNLLKPAILPLIFQV